MRLLYSTLIEGKILYTMYAHKHAFILCMRPQFLYSDSRMFIAQPLNCFAGWAQLSGWPFSSISCKSRVQDVNLYCASDNYVAWLQFSLHYFATDIYIVFVQSTYTALSHATAYCCHHVLVFVTCNQLRQVLDMPDGQKANIDRIPVLSLTFRGALEQVLTRTKQPL